MRGRVINFVIYLTACFAISESSFGVYSGIEQDYHENDDEVTNFFPEKWFDLPVDHFNASDERVWNMRYYENAANFDTKNGLIFVVLGGEWNISEYYVKDSAIYSLSRDVGALIYYIENRYHGKSKPTIDVTKPEPRLWNVDQTLADIAKFIEHEKREKNAQNVVIFGGTYFGDSSIWMRLKYPHLVQGVVGSSTPFEKEDVVRTLMDHEKRCFLDLKLAIYDVVKTLSEKNGPAKIQSLFGFCNVPKAGSQNDSVFLVSTLNSILSDTGFENYCNSFLDEKNGPLLNRLAHIVKSADICHEIRYPNVTETSEDDFWIEENAPTNDAAVHWACLDYSPFKAGDSQAFMLHSLIGLDFYAAMCLDLYEKTNDVLEKGIVQPLNHFDRGNNHTWLMRYYEKQSYYKPGGPIFIYLAGEWTADVSKMQAGFFHDLALDVNALMICAEHRYYGKSLPFKNITSENLKQLRVSQALADVARLIRTIKKQRNIETAKVIAFGCSYSASLAVWARLKYPSLVQGALASSAPIFAKVNFKEYYAASLETLRNHKKECASNVENAIRESMQRIYEHRDLEKLKFLYNLCSLPNTSEPNDIALFATILADTIGKIAQEGYSIRYFCNVMTHLGKYTAMENFARFAIGQSYPCATIKYEEYLTKARNCETGGVDIRYIYQLCNEFGNFQTTDSLEDIFGKSLGISFYVNLCRDLFDASYVLSTMTKNIEKSNAIYSDQVSKVTRVIFVNGLLDPWHHVSVLKPVNDETHAFFVNSSSHCYDVYSGYNVDSQQLKDVKQKNVNIIKSWIV